LLRPSGYVRDPLDFYVEDEDCVESLFAAESDWEEPILDPACGSGNIVHVCQALGWQVVGTDIAARGFGWQKRDFLAVEPIVRPAAIICNPPYRIAVKFIKRALALGIPKFAMLVGDKFRYSQARWYELFRDHPPARVYVLSRRPSLLPGELYLAGKIDAKGGTKDYEWMVWDRAHSGPTFTIWLPPDRHRDKPQHTRLRPAARKVGVAHVGQHRRKAGSAEQDCQLASPEFTNSHMTDAERRADAIANYDEALRAMRNRGRRH
jgi:hypothetical protein